jgi:hypothetical protein
MQTMMTHTKGSPQTALQSSCKIQHLTVVRFLYEKWSVKLGLGVIPATAKQQNKKHSIK